MFLALKLLYTQALYLKHLCVCIYKQRGIITSYCKVFPKHFSFQCTRKVAQLFFRTVSCCMHDSACPKKKVNTNVKSFESITIPTIQKSYKVLGLHSSLRTVFAAYMDTVHATYSWQLCSNRQVLHRECTSILLLSTVQEW